MPEYARYTSYDNVREKPEPPPLRAVGDYVLLRPIEREERTDGGLYIPQTSAEKNITYEAEVLACKDEYRFARYNPAGLRKDEKRSGDDYVYTPEYGVGDRVLYYRFDAKRMYLQDGSVVHAVPVEAIVAVVE